MQWLLSNLNPMLSSKPYPKMAMAKSDAKKSKALLFFAHDYNSIYWQKNELWHQSLNSQSEVVAWFLCLWLLRNNYWKMSKKGRKGKKIVKLLSDTQHTPK